jgi:tripartite-type tricarboxylate transporter receptor subunit TctC
LQDPGVRARLAGQGADVLGSTPAEYAAYIRAEMPRWARAIKESGAKSD